MAYVSKMTAGGVSADIRDRTTHGNITEAGAIGTSAGLPVMTGTDGVLEAIPVNAALENLGAAGNRNLLDNWDFRNPVNQRGVSGETGTGAGYIIDRWKKAHGTVSMSENGITLSSVSDTTSYGNFNQVVPVNFNGETVTISVMVDGIVYSNTGQLTGSTTSGIQAYFPDSATRWGYIRCTKPSNAEYHSAEVIFYSGGIGHTINAVKLEYGPVSTLENDPPMDYAAELLKCQRYYQIYSSSDARPSTGIDCRPVMRISNPTQGTVSIDGTTYYYNSADY